MLRRLVLSVIGALAFGSAAIAQTPTFSWQGLYAGFVMGNPRDHVSWAETGGTQSLSGDWRRGPIGPVAGYNWQRGSMVFGVEGDYGLNNVYSNSISSAAFDCGTGCEIDMTRLVSLRARLGQAVDRSLFYVTAGLYAAQVETWINGTATGSGTQVGWIAGAGMEFATGRRARINVEYLIASLGRIDIGAPCVTDCTADVRHGLFRVGVRWALGGPRPERVVDSGPRHDWSGAYWGGQLSAVSLSRGQMTTNGGADATTFAHWGGNALGLVAGYFWQRGGLVAGVEGSLRFGNREARMHGTPGFDCGTEETCVLGLRNTASLMARVGYAHERFLYFFSLGATSTQVAAGYSDIGTVTTARSFGGSYAFGMGYAIDDRTRVLVELRVNRISGIDVGAPCAGGCVAYPSNGEVLVTWARRW